MNIAISTANLYFIPFKKTLEIYKKAGYEYIELAGYWQGGEWEMAQHLKDVKPKDVIRLVNEYGLKISTFHDMGGIIEKGQESIISPLTYEYLEHYDFPCLVFHTPHKKAVDMHWWEEYKHKTIFDLQKIRGNKIICLENLFNFENSYYVPLISPHEMLEFVSEADIYANIDTTHFAQSEIDIAFAADVLKSKTKTIHLSDYHEGKHHVYLGEGDLDFKQFFDKLDLNQLHAITIECALPHEAGNEELTIRKAKEAREFVERFIGVEA